MRRIVGVLDKNVTLTAYDPGLFLECVVVGCPALRRT
jgi:hypothetical protein